MNIVSDGLSVTPSFPICAGMKQNERNIFNGRLLPLWITSIPNTFGDNGELRLYQQFLINVPLSTKSWMISYTVCHLLLTGFLKWSNFPHTSRKKTIEIVLVEWFIFWLENQLFLFGKFFFFFFFFFSTKIVYPTIVQLKYQRAVCCKVEKVRLASCWYFEIFSFLYFHLGNFKSIRKC